MEKDDGVKMTIGDMTFDSLGSTGFASKQANLLALLGGPVR